MAQHNRCFKTPLGRPPQRSPSPPNAWIEPLSPTRSRPVEPSFSYAAPHANSAFTTPAAGQGYGTSHKSSHRRTSSTIDTLAEAALGVGLTRPERSHKTAEAFKSHEHGRANGYRSHHSHGGSEPPHKRARSEAFPTTQSSDFASRPATSYTPHDWQHGSGYNTRVEEAALLLNFQSGGWPNSSSTSLDQTQLAAQRHHANNLSINGNHAAGGGNLMQPALLPPFDPHTSVGALPSSQDSKNLVSIAEGSVALPETLSGSIDTPMPDKYIPTYPSPPAQPKMESAERLEGMTALETGLVTPAGTSSELSAPSKRRGWPKGKPRGSGARKPAAEKSTSKRTSRKKTPASRSRKSKQTPLSPPAEQFTRRKSLGDMSDEMEVLHDMTTASRRLSVPSEVQMIIRPTSPLKNSRRRHPVDAEIICAACAIVREAGASRGYLDEWISCNGCKNWYHIDCAGFRKAHEIRDVDKYFCTACEPKHGKTTYVRKSARAHASVDYAELQRGVLKTSEESVEHHYIQPIKDGTFEFDPEFFPRMRPEVVTREFFEKSGTFTEPICIPAEWNPRPWTESDEWMDTQVEGSETHPSSDMLQSGPLAEAFEYDALPNHGQDRLGMVMPEGLTVRQVCNLVGADTPLDVIDVKTQNSGAKWTLSRWADYYEDGSEEKTIRNVISLEVSQTRLGRLLQRPQVVRDIDLQDEVWPQEETDKGKWPKVQFYCLMSVADSYTDFHIDFGGSSVYYHILKGQKTFFFIPPKAKHLKAYEEWNDSPQQNYTFLPHVTKECYRVDLHEGDTMLIPSGWIHAVWTPADSLVIGGNFLNRMAYKNQFKVVEIEKANETPIKFRYPFFQRIMWYTAIKYLRDDPLPPAVCRMLYEGKQFAREQPIWADFDGDGAQDNEAEPDAATLGLRNARYYGQAEIEGLPDLVNFIFRTVMLVMGRLEGVSQDRMKRVNASIPKGYGEPLEVAKTFALWVAWKRGNEDPPAWAHPDAVLPNSTLDGPPKKLSERKLKELERREAIAAHRVAPDRQSARVLSRTTAAAAAAPVATSSAAPASASVSASATAAAAAAADFVNPSPDSAHHQFHLHHGEHSPDSASMAIPGTPSSVPPTAFVMSGVPGHHLSTPKTSVLGPKRVACDACRKRRIRCKHKDLVVQASPNGSVQMDAANGLYQPAISPDLQDTNGGSPQQFSQVNFVHNMLNGQRDGTERLPNGDAMTNGVQPLTSDGTGPNPGTNAYINANIPMTMNGVPIFGEIPKRGRSKACYECRKSKRRCVHDESGNVDPVKAAESPVPRGVLLSKKRPFPEDGQSAPEAKKFRAEASPYDFQSQNKAHMNGLGLLKPLPMTNGSTNHHNSNGFAQTQRPQQQQQQRQIPLPKQEPPQPQIDPNLFSAYDHTPVGLDQIPNGHTETRHTPYHHHSTSFELPSLEEIANEVLVDMTGNDVPPDSFIHQPNDHAHGPQETATLTNGHSRPDGSVDSGIDVGAIDKKIDTARTETITDGHTLDNSAHDRAVSNGETNPEESHQPRDSIEQSDSEPSAKGTIRLPDQTAAASQTAISAGNDIKAKSVSDIPLYRPPAPVSQSPEATRRPSSGAHGATRFKPTSPVVTKVKPDSPAKRSKQQTKTLASHPPEPNGSVLKASDPTEDERSLELARMLQQEDLGLRRRGR